jgi:UDP-N-acetylmuramate: L-alanyl-gamma-D-glutamyl-meso-diaminopimelate ligase
MNINGARLVCQELGVDGRSFYQAIQSFRGASKRLERVAQNNHTSVYKDFAHSPSKLKATTEAVKKQYPGRELVACIELHTFSSLSEKFLDHYRDCLADADIGVVYFSPHALSLKRLPPLTKEQVAQAFGGDNLQVFTDPVELKTFLMGMDWSGRNLLMMSSGNFDGLRVEDLGKAVTAAS